MHLIVELLADTNATAIIVIIIVPCCCAPTPIKPDDFYSKVD